MLIRYPRFLDDIIIWFHFRMNSSSLILNFSSWFLPHASRSQFLRNMEAWLPFFLLCLVFIIILYFGFLNRPDVSVQPTGPEHELAKPYDSKTSISLLVGIHFAKLHLHADFLTWLRSKVPNYLLVFRLFPVLSCKGNLTNYMLTFQWKRISNHQKCLNADKFIHSSCFSKENTDIWNRDVSIKY